MTKAEKQHLNKVADLGCLVCRNMGRFGVPAEIHHIRSGQGMSQRASHYETLPLCPEHHRLGSYGKAFHAGRKAWEANFGQERELLEQVNKLLEIQK